jgi:ABC-2 type transport system permease protein
MTQRSGLREITRNRRKVDGGFAFVAVLLLYGQLISMGYFVAMGGVEEKSTRVVEVVLSTLRPRHLLAGKILGLGLLGLAQLLLALAWFVVGYAFYAAAFGCAAALVSRQEDLQSVISPLTIVLMVGFFISFAVLEDPDGTSRWPRRRCCCRWRRGSTAAACCARARR